MPDSGEEANSSYQYDLPWQDPALSPTVKKGLFGRAWDALTGGTQTTVVWEADDEGRPPPQEHSIDPVPVGHQRGFFMNAGEDEFHTRPKKDDEMIKPPKSKKKKPGGKTTFQRVVEFEAGERARIYGSGIDTVETVNAGKRIEIHTGGTVQVSTVGESGLRFRTEHGSQPPVPDFSTLSPSAQKLYRKRRADEREAVEELKRQARENERRERAAQQVQGTVFVSDQRVSPKSIYPGKAENVRWETLRRMIQGVRDGLK